MTSMTSKLRRRCETVRRKRSVLRTNDKQTALSSNSNESQHVPVYRQKDDEQCDTMHDDPYAFGCDIGDEVESVKPRKIQRKKKIAVRKSFPRLEKIAQKPVTYEKKIEGVLKNVLNIINEKRLASGVAPIPSKRLSRKDTSPSSENIGRVDAGGVSARVTPPPSPDWVNNTPSVKILQDITITTGGKSENSLHHDESQSKGHLNDTSWRYYDPTVTRNPHLMYIKKSALPCVCQDMVLDQSVVEQLVPSAESTAINHSAKANSPIALRQPDLMEVLEQIAHVRDDNKENITNNDIDIQQGILFLSDEENHPPSPIKRTALSNRNDNNIVMMNSTPKTAIQNRNIGAIRLSDWSFDEVENEENAEINRGNEIVKAKEDRPFRVSVTYKNRKERKFPPIVDAPPLPKAAHEHIDALEMDNHEAMSDNSLSDDPSCHLFEDISANPSSPPNKKSKRRNKKVFFLAADDENAGQSRKRKRDGMTKAEEKAFLDWAKKFNDMCDEVDKHQLELEVVSP